MPGHPLNATAASLLGFLHEGPLTGWDLVVVAQQRVGDFWSLTKSQVYRELRTMAADGLIDAGERGVRDRQPFTLTPAGREAFRQWLERDPGPDLYRSPFLLLVSFGRHVPPDRLASLVAGSRVAHARQLAEYETLRAAGPDDPFSRATLDFGIAYERAVLDWFDALPEAVAGARRAGAHGAW